ncbi:MAG TPA: NAD(P)H-binding protein [Myxococcota bacterium]|jgi:putative NADH-flavin reductase
MKIVVLGATGTTGALVLDEALAAGHAVVALVRRPEAMAARDGLTVACGSVEDLACMRAAFAGADAVISCLGARMTPRILFRGTDFQRRTLPLILSALAQANVKRFVLMSSFGSGDTAAKASLFPRILFYQVIAKKLFDDKVIAERSLAGCDANWTAVYPVTLKKGPLIPSVDVVPLSKVRKVPGLPVVPFANVAKVLVSLVANQDQPTQRLLVTTPGGWR